MLTTVVRVVGLYIVILVTLISLNEYDLIPKFLPCCLATNVLLVILLNEVFYGFPWILSILLLFLPEHWMQHIQIRNWIENLQMREVSSAYPIVTLCLGGVGVHFLGRHLGRKQGRRVYAS